MRACHGVGVVVVSVCGRRERALSSTSLFQWLAADGLFPPPPICLHRLRLLRRPSPGFGECRRTLFLFYAGNESRTSSLPLMSFHHRFSMRHTVNIGNREINVSGHVGKRLRHHTIKLSTPCNHLTRDKNIGGITSGTTLIAFTIC